MQRKLFLLQLSSFLCSQAARPEPCLAPANPPHGEWVCSSTTHSLSCSLGCDPGWVVQGRSVVSCVDGDWTEPGINYGCTAVEALLIAGNAVLGRDGWTAELYGQYHGKDLSQDQRMLPALSEQRTDSSLDFVNSKVLLCGGWGSRTSKTCSYFLPESGTWNTSHYSTWYKYGRADHMSVVMGGKLYLLGGDNNQEPYTTEYIEPCASNTAQPGIDLATWYSGACAVAITQDTFAVIGGYQKDSCEGFCGSRSAMLYNITSGARYELPSMRYARMDHDCVMYRDPQTREKYILVTGGRYERQNYLGNTEIWKVGDRFWREVGQLRTPRSSLKLAVMEKKILAFGGFVANENGGTPYVEEYDVASGTWSVARSMIYPRAGHSVTPIPSDLNNSC